MMFSYSPDLSANWGGWKKWFNAISTKNHKQNVILLNRVVTFFYLQLPRVTSSSKQELECGAFLVSKNVTFLSPHAGAGEVLAIGPLASTETGEVTGWITPLPLKSVVVGWRIALCLGFCCAFLKIFLTLSDVIWRSHLFFLLCFLNCRVFPNYYRRGNLGTWQFSSVFLFKQACWHEKISRPH